MYQSYPAVPSHDIALPLCQNLTSIKRQPTVARIIILYLILIPMNKYCLSVAIIVLLLSVLVDAGVTRFPYNKRDFCCDSGSFLSFMPGFSKSWCCDLKDKKVHDTTNSPSEIHHHRHTPSPTANQHHPSHHHQQQETSSHYATTLDSTPATIIVNINNPTPTSTTTAATPTKTQEQDTREHCKKLDEKGCSSDERCYWEDSPSEAGKYINTFVKLSNVLTASCSSRNWLLP